ncbi:MAG: hypothetical protein ABIP48_25000, partial [Planctomycetota bacterium]
RLGYAVLGSDRFRLFAVPGRPCIWRGDGTMYHTCRLEFVHAPPAAGETVADSSDDREWVHHFAVVSCPNQTRGETAALAHRMGGAGWHVAEDGALALVLDRYLVYANFSSEAKSVSEGNQSVPLAPKTSGWVTRAPSSPSSLGSRPVD